MTLSHAFRSARKALSPIPQPPASLRLDPAQPLPHTLGRFERPESSLLHDLMLPLAALPFPNIDPVIIHLGPVAIRWYGAGYIVGILFAWWYANRLIGNGRLWPGGQSPLKPDDIDDLL